ncbi:MAG: histidine--tRNA ligase [Gammaproteobacteria bacterium]|nr:histidine--tRNA ligase [Gammaproteobacteria bacterium]
MAGTYRLVRGMRDILPGVTGRWREVEAVVVDVLDRYGYTEIRLPLIEATELFSRGVGEATDLVEKEMFTFADRKGKSLSLRPEGTAGCARACIENGLLHNQTPKLWYRGSMFRYERPQKGRSREHTQIGAEVFGLPGPDIDAEMLTMLGRMFRELGIADRVTLELNTIGSQESRLRYRKALLDYLTPHAANLDPDSRRRLDTNPLRILDSKVATTRGIVAGAPRMDAYLDRASREHFDGLRRALDAAHVGYAVNPFLVRGLDYYTHTVFEWVTEALGAQNAVSSGGRYDGLVERLGGRPTPGLGFGMGLDRVVLLHAENVQRCHARADVFVAVAEPEHAHYGAAVAEHVRDRTTLRVLQHAVGGLRSQIREADRSGARWAVIVGDDEVAENRVSLKWLRADRPQSTMDLDALIKELNA